MKTYKIYFSISIVCFLLPVVLIVIGPSGFNSGFGYALIVLAVATPIFLGAGIAFLVLGILNYFFPRNPSDQGQNILRKPLSPLMIFIGFFLGLWLIFMLYALVISEQINFFPFK